MLATSWWILERDLGAAFFRLRRTPQPTVALDKLEEVMVSLERALAGVDRSHLGLLVDLREGPMRNDPEFERAAAPFQLRMLSGFRRVAVLVKTPVGKLQVRRLLARRVPAAEIFDDEEAALAHLTARS
jgi:hypothetical protein